jgi:hemerythrin-like domain-containing protein
MKITEALLGEHGVFYALFDQLEKAVPASETLSLVQSQGALLAAALKPHASMEDELLFSSLESHLGTNEGPLAVMRTEHNEIEGALARVQEVKDLAEARALVLHAVRTAREHFAKEEQVLFPMAEQVLGAEALTQLTAAWAERRGVTIA